MKFLEGILLHELVLIILGFMAGLALLFAFVRSVQRDKANYKPIYALIMPLLMIGYPSIQRIQFENGVLNIEKVTKEIEKNPLDTALHQQLLSEVKGITGQSSRLNESPTALSAVANAQLVLGRYDSAQALVYQAAKLDSTATPVVKTKQSVKKRAEAKKKFDQKVNQVDKQLKVLEKQPQNKVVRDSILQALKEVSNEHVTTDDNSLMTMAQAAAATGHTSTALELLNKVLKVKPSIEAMQLKEQITSGALSKKYNIGGGLGATPKSADSFSIKAIPNAFVPY